MISKKKQQDYLRIRWENILHNFEQFAKRTNAQSIHKIRVDLKKLRALIFLQEESGNAVSGKEKSLLKELFQQAGKIREAQVTSQLVRSNKVSAREFLDTQKRKVMMESKAFVQLVREKTDRVVELNMQLWRHVKPVSKKSSGRILRKLFSGIGKSYKPQLKPGELHSSRKKIKRYVYIVSMMKKAKQNKIAAVTADLRRLEDAVGKWHDAEVTIQLLKRIAGNSGKLKKLTAISTRRLQMVRKLAGEIF